MVKHRIGNNSPYDADMDLIEMYIKYANNSNNLHLMLEIKKYYISRALHYWSKLEEYLKQDTSSINSTMRNPNGKNTIVNNLLNYRDKFLDMIDDLENNFNIKKVMYIFKYIGSLNCFHEPNNKLKDISITYMENELKQYNIDSNRIFPLVNDNGEFAFNTWLYAFFENIDLVGFTSEDASYDGESGCSLDMYVHDLQHINDIYYKYNKNSNKYNIYKNIYYNILQSDGLTSREKELYIFILWIIIHEITQPINLNKSIEDIILKIHMWTYTSSAPLIINTEFQKYANLLLTDINLHNAFYILNSILTTMHDNIDNIYTYNIEIIKYDSHSILTYIHTRDISILNYNQYMILALVHFLIYIKDHYDYYST